MVTAFADLAMALHVAFLVFLFFGGYLVLWCRSLLRPHIVAVTWGVTVTVLSIECPLTTLEVALRERVGSGAYNRPFIEHYFEDVVYPAGHTGIARAIAVLIVAQSYILVALRAARTRQMNVTATTTKTAEAG